MWISLKLTKFLWDFMFVLSHLSMGYWKNMVVTYLKIILIVILGLFAFDVAQ